MSKATALADECIEFAASLGTTFDPYQAGCLQEEMVVDRRGSWKSKTVADCDTRQDGKGERLQARELYGAHVLSDRIMHTAHHMETAKNAFDRAEAAIMGSWLEAEIDQIAYGKSPGPTISFLSGGVIAYRARSGKAGRGLDDVSLVVYDEAQHLPEEHVAASSPASGVAEHSQIWFAGSGGLASSAYWWGLRLKAIIANGKDFAGGSFVQRVGTMVWLERTAESWTMDQHGRPVFILPDEDDRANWYLASSAMEFGRFNEDWMVNQRLLLPKTFVREHLGAWDPLPGDKGTKQDKIATGDWAAQVDSKSSIEGGLVYTVALNPEQDGALINATGHRVDGDLHTETIESSPGITWVPARLAALVAKNRPDAVAYDSMGPASSLAKEVEGVCSAATPEVPVVRVGTTGYVSACQNVANQIEEGKLWHLGDIDITNAISAANVRAYGVAQGEDGEKVQRWAWAQSSAAVALAAMTVGVWASGAIEPKSTAYDEDYDFDPF